MKRARVPRSGTRQRIIDAAIRCLAAYGYAGTNMNVVSVEAGLSRGPRQYYFPQKVDLMVAAWEQIVDQAKAQIDQLDLTTGSMEDQLRRILELELHRATTDNYIADLELKLAIRGDAELDQALMPLMMQLEAEADEYWLSKFGGLASDQTQLLAIRYSLSFMIRGFAIERISNHSDSFIESMKQELVDHVFNQLKSAKTSAS